MKDNIHEGKKVLITGASSGIGLEFARLISQYDCELIIVSSKADVLNEAKSNLEKKGLAKIRVIAIDLAKVEGAKNLWQKLEEQNLIPDILINNAGIQNYGYFHQINWEEQERQIILNSLTPIYLIHQVLPRMIKNNFGRILNVGSVAGTMPGPFFAVYGATKAFLNSFSQSLSGELKDKNIICTCLLPGSTNSPKFWNVPNLYRDISRFASPAAVAEFGLKLLAEDKDYGVYGWNNRAKQFIKRFIPRKVLNYALYRHTYSPLLDAKPLKISPKEKLIRFFSKLNRGSGVIGALIKYKITKKPFPLCVHLQITKRCNLRCVYCYADKESLVNVPDLKYNEYVALIDNLAKMGTKWIRFLGGEPLLRNDIGQMIDYAKAKCMVTEMNTNGYFMAQKGEAIKNLDSLVVSIDGTRETNDTCRGEGSYDKAIRAIEIAKDLGMSVRLHGCLSKYHQIKDTEHLASLAVKYGTAFNFSAPSPVYYGDDVRMNAHPSQKQVAILHHRCEELKALGYPLTNTNTAAEYIKKWPKPESDIIVKDDIVSGQIDKKTYVSCAAGKLYCTIDIDGKVYACATLWRDALSYKEVGLQKAWEHINNPDCLSCNYIANIELNLLLGLNPKTLWEIASYVLGRTAKIGKKINDINKPSI